MKINQSQRVAGIGSYAFADVDNEVAKLKKEGIEPIDFGVGDRKEPTPGLIRNECKRAIDKEKEAGYPSYIGSPSYRDKIAEWTQKRFSVSLDTSKEICSTIGAKEAVFNFHAGIVNPGDYVLVPNPGYPPYERGTTFAGGKVHFMNLLKENNFLPDLESIPKDVVKKAKLMWINYPNNPTGALATKEFLKGAVDFGADNDIIIGSDECYTEIYFEEKPLSILNIAREGVFAVQSLSKRSAMTSYRVGWLAGDSRIIDIFKKVKTNIDSGTPQFITDAAIAALSDESHVEEFRNLYRKKRNIIADAFKAAGLEDCRPDSTLYIWQKINGSSVEFAKKLLAKDIAIVTTPGNWISCSANGANPGEGYIRLAMVPTVKECKIAAERIRIM